jgi:hypothetical protein
MVLTNLILVLAFYGYTRFAFALEPFLFPFAALLAERIIRWTRCRKEICWLFG